MADKRIEIARRWGKPILDILATAYTGLPVASLADALVEQIKDKQAPKQIREALFRKPTAFEAPRRGSNAVLLRAERGIVPFAGRDDDLAEFDIWFDGPEPMKWRLLTGPSGRGKTRFMQHVVENYRAKHGDRILAGFVDLDALIEAPAVLGGFLAHSGDILLVVDYAERVRTQTVAILKLALMLEEAARTGQDLRVRLVMIARGLSEMWGHGGQGVGRDHEDIQAVLDAEGGLFDHPHFPPLVSGLEAREEEFARAYQAFDAALREVRLDQGTMPAADQIPPLGPEGDRDGFREAVMIHLAALAALQEAMSPADMSTAKLLDWVVRRDRAEWARRTAALGLPDAAADEALDQAVGVVTLVSAASQEPNHGRVVELLGQCPALSDQSDLLRRALARMIEALYLGENGPAGLTPDLIGTWFLGKLDPAFFGAVFPSLSEQETVIGLTKLNWLAQSWQVGDEAWNADGADRVSAALSASPSSVLPLVVDVARQSGDPIGRIAAEWFERSGTGDLALAVVRRQDLPYPTTALREFAMQVETTLLHSVGGGGSERDLATKARQANNLSVRLSDLGRREAALAAVEKAVALYRALAEARPDAFTPDLARSLGAFGSVLRAADRHDEAADRFGEGLRLLAPYLERLPQAVAPLCASLLQNHLQGLLAAGREADWDFLAPVVEILVEQGALDLGDLGGSGDAGGPPEAP